MLCDRNYAMQDQCDGKAIAGIIDRCLFWFSVWGWGVGGYLGHKGGPGSVVISRGIFYVAFSKEIWCMPLQMAHYSYDKQVWK